MSSQVGESPAPEVPPPGGVNPSASATEPVLSGEVDSTAADPISAAVPRDAASWAQPVERLAVTPRTGARGTNVAGRRLTGPVQGFGRLWQKSYQTEVGAAVSPEQVIAAWKAHFADFWPKGNRFSGALTGINPGDVALLDLKVGGTRLSTGVLVMYADDVSFTFMTPQGHMFAAWITFAAAQEESGGPTVVSVQILLRANDPIYEVAMTLGGARKEDKFWEHTLRALAAHLGVEAPVVSRQRTCVDPHRQWRNARNVWQNAAIRSMLQTLALPFTALARGRRTGGPVA